MIYVLDKNTFIVGARAASNDWAGLKNF